MKLLLILFLSLFLSGNFVFAQSEKNTVRVGLSNQSFSSRDFRSVTVSSINIIKIVDMSQNTQIEAVEANKPINITMSEDGFYNIFIDNELKYENLSGPLLLSSNAELQIFELNRKGTPAKYKGMLELRKGVSSGSFNVINVIDLQNYLRGVTPNEMPVSFGLEALKAQAVAARNYVTNAKVNPNYDVVDSTASQVYYGANSYNPLSDRAVGQTQGIYALYNEKPISALYFSTSAGITDDWDDVFGSGIPSNSHPYLKARFDKPGQKPLKTEQDVIDFYSRKDNGLDVNSQKFRWSVEFSRKDLEKVLQTTLQQQSMAGLVTPKFDGDIPFEGLKEIKAIKRTQSGKITELLIRAKSGEYVVKKELGIRRVLKKNNAMLPSANFFIETSGKEALEPENKEEDSFIIKLFESDEKYPANFKFVGGGFGHGVGMSQFGAYNLAKIGKKYPEILRHYYTGINLSTMPKTVLFNEYNISYKTEFYYDSETYKNVFLYINNKRGVSRFPFKINDFDFSDTKQIAVNKVSKINITQYLRPGLNKIDFAPLTRENRGKYIIYRVEFL